VLGMTIGIQVAALIARSPVQAIGSSRKGHARLRFCAPNLRRVPVGPDRNSLRSAEPEDQALEREARLELATLTLAKRFRG
jgi:hypothetical protein